MEVHWKRLGASALVSAFVLMVSVGAQAGTTPIINTAPFAVAASSASTTPVLVVGDGSAAQTVAAHGGAVSDTLADGTLVATVPSQNLAALAVAPGIRQVVPNVPMTSAGAKDDTSIQNAPQVWKEASAITQLAAVDGIDGSGVTIAVIDSGVDPKDKKGLGKRLVDTPFGSTDELGHGTFVAGLAAGADDDDYAGVASAANIIGLKTIGADGVTRLSDVIKSIDWAIANRRAFNIRVLNISATATTPSSYLLNPLNAAVERAWFSGIVVVVAAGNGGPSDSAISVAPANDPFVITVGALDDQGTGDTSDDNLAPWSSQGVTLDGISKPDVVAPGRHLISLLAHGRPTLLTERPDRFVPDRYLQLSGTSASAPVVSGIVALLLDAQPDLTPDGVKARLVGTGRPLAGSAAPRVDAYSAAFASTESVANRGIPINLLLANAADLFDPRAVRPATANWHSLTLAGVTWNALTTDSTSFQSINWDSITWDSITWDSITWDSITWDSITWDAVGSPPPNSN